MVRFPEASARKMKNIFVCRRCKTKMRASAQRVRLRKIVCRRCYSKIFRPMRKKSSKAAAAAK